MQDVDSGEFRAEFGSNEISFPGLRGSSNYCTLHHLLEVEGGASSYDFFGRRAQRALNVDSAPGFTLKGFSFFASGLRVHNSPGSKVRMR